MAAAWYSHIILEHRFKVDAWLFQKSSKDTLLKQFLDLKTTNNVFLIVYHIAHHNLNEKLPITLLVKNMLISLIYRLHLPLSRN